MTETQALKPCPFCGGHAELRKWDWPYERHQVRCSVCKAEGAPRKAIYSEAITAWNTRAADQAEANADDRYPAVFHARTDPPRIGVARYRDTADSITIAMPLENKPGARWMEGEFSFDEAEQIALHILKKVKEGRKHLRQMEGPAHAK